MTPNLHLPNLCNYLNFAVLFLAVGLCGIICAEDAGDEFPAEQTSVPSEHSRKGLIDRQRNGISLTAFEETLDGAEEVFERDCRNITLMMEKCAGLENDKLFLLLISIVFCFAVMVFGLKKIKHPGKESEQPEQQ